jgi:DNA-3-methyladenine glycosylase II
VTPSPYRALAHRDPVLAALVRRLGEPDPFAFPDGGRTDGSNFAALVLHILSQQISTAVAFVLFDRLRAAIGRVPDPDGVLALGHDTLRAAGLSNAKATYLLGLAQAQRDGRIDVDGLAGASDPAAFAALTSIRGIGRWSAEMFLLLQLHRADIVPAADIGIRRAVLRAWALPDLPGTEDVRRRAAAWSPYGSYATALLWASLAD